MEDVKPTITESKLFKVARGEQLLSSMIPALPNQMAVETEIDAAYPRTEDDKDHTRIWVNFRNLKGNDMLVKVADTVRLESTFDIDKFLSGYSAAIMPNAVSTDDVENVNVLLLGVLNTALLDVLKINGDKDLNKRSTVANNVLTALISIIYNDPLDVFISLQEKASKTEGQGNDAVIQAMWQVKQRS
jgi:hypothetical protein